MSIVLDDSGILYKCPVIRGNYSQIRGVLLTVDAGAISCCKTMEGNKYNFVLQVGADIFYFCL